MRQHDRVSALSIWSSNAPARVGVALAWGAAARRRVRPNPSIERTSQRPLRALCDAAHVER
jgi:hypothetical protein